MTVEQLWRWLKKKLFSERPDTGLTCGRCGAKLVSRNFCRECGASEESGWGDSYVGEETEDDFDYDDFVRREFGQNADGSKAKSNQHWILILFIVLIAGMIMMQFGVVRF